VTEVLVSRIADYDAKLEAALDKVEVAKYRELAKFARFDFERRRPLLYGQKQEGGGQQVIVVRMNPLRGGPGAEEEIQSVESVQAHAVSQSRGLPRLRDSVAQVQAGEGEEEEESENGDEKV
jgi:hypothetical protein